MPFFGGIKLFSPSRSVKAAGKTPLLQRVLRLGGGEKNEMSSVICGKTLHLLSLVTMEQPVDVLPTVLASEAVQPAVVVSPVEPVPEQGSAAPEVDATASENVPVEQPSPSKGLLSHPAVAATTAALASSTSYLGSKMVEGGKVLKEGSQELGARAAVAGGFLAGKAVQGGQALAKLFKRPGAPAAAGTAAAAAAAPSEAGPSDGSHLPPALGGAEEGEPAASAYAISDEGDAATQGSSSGSSSSSAAGEAAGTPPKEPLPPQPAAAGPTAMQRLGSAAALVQASVSAAGTRLAPVGATVVTALKSSAEKVGPALETAKGAVGGAFGRLLTAAKKLTALPTSQPAAAATAAAAAAAATSAATATTAAAPAAAAELAASGADSGAEQPALAVESAAAAAAPASASPASASESSAEPLFPTLSAAI